MDSEKKLTARQAARRNSILTTVRKTIDNVGLEGLSMRNIAAEAGVSPSTLYQIYKSKDGLVLAAMRNSIQLYGDAEHDCEPGVEHLLTRLKAVGTSIITSSETISHLLFNSEKETPVTELFLNGALEARKGTLLEMQRAKQIRPDADIELYARMLVDLTWGTILLYVKGIIEAKSVRSELIRTSFTLLLSAATRKSKPRMREIVDDYS